MQLTSSRLLYFFLIVSILISAFWRLGTHEVMRFDEARNGVNALEMLQNDDYINLHYAGEPDTWNAKPPLFIWMQALSFRVLGKNNFALRFPTALASLLLLFYIFKTVKLYRNEYFAIAVCFILLTVNGMYGAHVARTGDFDTLLTAFTTIGIYYFLRYFDFEDVRAIYWSALSFGLAFLTKGPAFGLVVPALLLYLVYRKKLFSVLKSRVIYQATAIFLIFPIFWFLIIQFFGFHSEQIEYSADNSFDRLFSSDIFDRFFNESAHMEEYLSRPDFFLIYLDTHFNIWNYIFLAGIGVGIYQSIKKKKVFAKSVDNLLVISVFLWASMALFLTLAVTNHRWYMMPALPFIAYTTVYFMNWCRQKYSKSFYVFVGIFLFTFIRHKVEYYNNPKSLSIISEQESILQKAPQVYFISTVSPRQELIFELYSKAKTLLFRENIENLKSGSLCVTRPHYWQDMSKETTSFISEKDDLVMFKIK